MFNYYMPLLYTFRTRYNSVINIISYLVITLFPSFFVILYFNEITFNLIIGYIVAFIAMHCIYECGYLFNDLITIKYEDNPTDRIGCSLSSLLLKHLQNIVTVRIVLAILASWYLINEYFNGYLFIELLIILFVTYSVHNFFRNRLNIITMSIMVSLKYIIPCIPFVMKEDLTIVSFILFLSVPLVRTVEYANKDRFRISFLNIDDFEWFRIKYYCITTFFAFIVVYFFDKDIFLVAILGFLLVFRIMTMLVMKNKDIFHIVDFNRKHNGNRGR